MPELKQKQQEEMKLWRRWMSGDNAAIGPLLKSYDPVVHSWVNKLSGSPLPRVFIETEVKKQILDAFRNFDPERKVQLNTYVHSGLRKVLRNTVYKYGNLGRIPEERQRMIFTFQSARDRLEEHLGRSPTAMEMGTDLNWEMKQVERMEKELRPSRLLTEEGQFSFLSDDRDQKALQFVYLNLPTQKQRLFEHHFGWAGKPKLKEADLATTLKIPVPQVKLLKKELADDLEKALQLK